jgi:hypothetical protein
VEQFDRLLAHGIGRVLDRVDRGRVLLRLAQIPKHGLELQRTFDAEFGVSGEESEELGLLREQASQHGYTLRRVFALIAHSRNRHFGFTEAD